MLSYANKIAIYRRTFNRKKIPNFAAKMNDGNFKNSEDKNQNLQIFGQGFETFGDYRKSHERRARILSSANGEVSYQLP